MPARLAVGGNYPRPGLWPEPPVAAPVAEIGSAAPPAAPTGAFGVGGSSQVAMDGLQLGLKGILERGADCHWLVPVGTPRSIAEVILIIFKVVV